jgi:hypothetical protein
MANGDDVKKGFQENQDIYHRSSDGNRRRLPHTPGFLHDLNAWLLPILVVALVGVGSFVANRVWNMNETIISVATVQKRVVSTLDVVNETVLANGQKLDEHLYSQRTNSIRHHQREISPCNGCHITR